MNNRVREIMANIFEISVNDINDDASSQNITNWDSLNHMNLIVALEEEFDIRFDDDEIIELTSLKQLNERLSSNRN